MACGCGIEDDCFVRKGFDLFEDFCEGHCFIDTGDLFVLACVRILWGGRTANARSCIIPPIPAAGPSPSSAWPINSCILPFGSISIALRLVKPSTSLASLPNFCEKASERLCAGSVEIRRTDRRTLASWMAREQEVVVFPTPPLPPTKIHRRVFWSRMD